MPDGEQMSESMMVLFLAPEMTPWAKTGGLADVAGALPSALARQGCDVRVVLPYYRAIKEKLADNVTYAGTVTAPIGSVWLAADVYETSAPDGVAVYLIDREDMFDRPNLYGNDRGDYYDNLERFTYYSHAALRLMELINIRPGVIHAHDWQTGLVPALLKSVYRFSPVLSGVPTVFTIHNIGYQGLFHPDKLAITGLSHEDFYTMFGLEYWDNISLLKSGLVYAEALTTVSPTYSREIQTAEYGRGMDSVLRSRAGSLSGILNGVDYNIWNPGLDKLITAHFTPDDLSGKKINKKQLIKTLSLDDSALKRPLIGMITRLEYQKGLDLTLSILPGIMDLGASLAILGSGDEGIQHALHDAVQRYPGRIGLETGFNERLAHGIMAGADLFLIPSRYEPCGLTQMYALKYGTVPVVRSTGGLEDTIVQFNPDTGDGNGFKFGPYDATAFYYAVREAIELFDKHPDTWLKLQQNGMAADFSWDYAALRYRKLFRSVSQRSVAVVSPDVDV
jgi:starch synthase